MGAWVDPKESASKNWAGEADEPDEPSMRSVRDRAFHTSLPFQYDTVVSFSGTLTGHDVNGTTYRWGKFRLNGGVTRSKALKFSADGYLWRGPGAPADGLRFKAQVTRESPPTDTEPFGEYEIWLRFQSGRVVTTDGRPTFEPDGTSLTTDRTTRSFDALPETTRVRVAELELVRNQPLATYALGVREEWGEYARHFRFMPQAFGGR
ncbi:hypothetical protein [Halorussus halobius]|uniref:hypothetical protein n=1 Tax=Halorussus halobius TaxID=1710537 RepID=UPI0010929BC7|nr:hypothetical protein [Halorussus halobius]